MHRTWLQSSGRAAARARYMGAPQPRGPYGVSSLRRRSGGVGQWRQWGNPPHSLIARVAAGLRRKRSPPDVVASSVRPRFQRAIRRPPLPL